MKVITFSQTFPKGHIKEGQPTYFVEKIWDSVGLPDKPYCFNLPECYTNFMRKGSDVIWPKHHTIRGGKRWKKGDWFSPRVWGADINSKSGKSGAYQSKQIEFLPPIEIKNVWDFDIWRENIYLNGKRVYDFCIQDFELIKTVAKNDGLELNDLWDWFKYPKQFLGQIISCSDQVKY